MAEATEAVEAEVSTVVVEEAFTAEVAADFMEAVAVADSMGEAEDSPAGTLDLVAAARLVVGIGAVTEATDITADMAAMDGAATATAGAAEVGATDTVTAGAVGAGDMVMAGRIGDGAWAGVGDIRMATTAIRITRPILIRILPTDIQRTP